MNLEKYKKLQEKFEQPKYEKTYFLTSKILYIGSFLGNLLSIIFAYFYLHNLTNGSAVHFSYQETILPIFIILFLTVFEFTKRFVFANIVTSYLINKLSFKLFTNSLFGILIIIISFWLSMSGAQTYSNQEKQITTIDKNIISIKEDSLNKVYQTDIDFEKTRIKTIIDLVKDKERNLSSNEGKQIKDLETKIDNLKKERDNKIELLKVNIIDNSKDILKETNKNQIAFLMLSGFIELLILVGVSFNCIYEYKMFLEQKQLLIKSSNFKKLNDYKEILKVLYNNGQLGQGEQLPTVNKLKQLLNTKRNINNKTVQEFLSLCSFLKITSMENKKKRIAEVSFEEANNILESYLPIDL